MGARGRHPRAIPSTLHHLVRLFPSILIMPLTLICFLLSVPFHFTKFRGRNFCKVGRL